MANAVDAQVSKYGDVALLIARILLGALFLIAAYNKVKGYSGGIGYFGKLGLPAPSVLLPLTILFEAAVGLMLIIGYQTRLAALGIALFCVATALIAHTNIADGNQFNHLLKNLAVAGGALALFVSGPGTQSVDAKQG
jgi:putative oxidoreductase